MQLVRHWQSPLLNLLQNGSVVTIGNFDGLHRGHQQLLTELQKIKYQSGLPSVVVIFEPQPQEFFSKNHPPKRLTNLRAKYKAFAPYEIDVVLCLRFNSHFAQIKATDFIDEILLGALKVRYLQVGDDFRFGYRREGDTAMLSARAKQAGFELRPCASVLQNHERISSSRIRHALSAGDLLSAKQLLGREFSVEGRVIHGQSLAKAWQMPTANVCLAQRTMPLHGVFAVKVEGIADTPLQGVACAGERPMVDNSERMVEVHVFDFSGDLYRKRLKITFCHKIRDQQKFDSMDKLFAQMQQDKALARAYFEKAS